MDAAAYQDRDNGFSLINTRSRPGADRLTAIELPSEPHASDLWRAALQQDTAARLELAYALTLSLPTPHVSGLRDRVRPLLHFDILSKLPITVARRILSHLDLQSVVTCSIVSRSWRRLAHSDQLLWRGFFVRAGWKYDEKAVAYWNALGVSTRDDGDAMSLDGESPKRMILSPPEDAFATDYFARSGSPSLGLPPSPRHLGHPASPARDPSTSFLDTSRSLRSPASSFGRELTPPPPVVSPEPPSPHSLDAAQSRQDPFQLRMPIKSKLGRRITPPRRLTLNRSTTPNRSMSVNAEQLPCPRSLDVSTVSSVHYDEFGRPAVNWRHLVSARHVARKNWRRGAFTVSELGPPEDGEIGVYSVQFNGRHVITGTRDGIVRMYDLGTNRIVRTFVGHAKSVLCLQFEDERVVSDDRQLKLVTGSSDHTVIVWELDTARPIFTATGHRDSVTGLRFADDVLVTCSKGASSLIFFV